MPLEDRIADYLRRSPLSKAREIASALGIDRGHVNSTLYQGANKRFRVDSEFRWALVGGTNGEVLARAEGPVPSSRLDHQNQAAVLQTRRTLARLKRGVPPTDAIDSLAIGMERFQRQLDQVL